MTRRQSVRGVRGHTRLELDARLAAVCLGDEPDLAAGSRARQTVHASGRALGGMPREAAGCLRIDQQRRDRIRQAWRAAAEGSHRGDISA